jgi:DNA-binding phage protein
MRRRTSFDDFFDEQIGDPAFAEAYRNARAEVDSVDSFMRALESARSVRGVSKATLARQSQLPSQTIRRLLTDEHANPTIATVFNMLRPMGLGLQIVTLRKGSNARKATSGRKSRSGRNEEASMTSGRKRASLRPRRAG